MIFCTDIDHKHFWIIRKLHYDGYFTPNEWSRFRHIFHCENCNGYWFFDPRSSSFQEATDEELVREFLSSELFRYKAGMESG